MNARFGLMAALAIGLFGCGSATKDMDSGASQDSEGYDLSREVVSEGGRFELSYVPEPDPIPPVENFSLLLRLSDSSTGEPVVGASLELDATMPEHNHGMNTKPPVVEVGEGDYRVDGMQFHMSGHWQMDFRIVVDDTVDTAVFHVVCCE